MNTANPAWLDTPQKSRFEETCGPVLSADLNTGDYEERPGF
jgi:hypothetical protein